MNSKLTSTEQTVYNCLMDGLNYIETAKKLFVERTTVASHVQRIYQKMGVKSQRELMAKEYKKKLNEVTNE